MAVCKTAWTACPTPRLSTIHRYWIGAIALIAEKSTFVRNHSDAIVGCDFFVTVTATFRVVYVFVAMEIGSWRILHCYVTEHPTAEWTTQQFREILAEPHPYRFVLYDRDANFLASLDITLKDFGIRALYRP